MEKVRVPDITITSLDTIKAFEVVSGDYMFTLDELQNASINQTQEKQDIVGKQGRKLNSLKKNKAVTISGTNGLMSSGMLELQTGSDFEDKVTTVEWEDIVTVKTNAAATNFKAVGTKGAEITAIYVIGDDQMYGKKLTQAEGASEGKFTYDPESKAITLNSGEVEDGREIAVIYKRQIKAYVLENFSDKYSGKCSLYIDATGEDKCGNIYRVQFYVPKADFNGEFTFEMGDNQSVHAFEAESLAGGCGGSTALWTYTVFGENAADAEAAGMGA